MASLLLKKAQKASSQLKSKAQKEIEKRKSNNNAHISKELTTKEDRQVLDAVNDSTSKKKKNYEKYLDLPVIASANLWKRRSGLGGKFRNSKKQGTSTTTTTTTTTSTSNSSWELRRFELRGTALLYYACDGTPKEEEEIDFGNETPENVKTDITRETWKSTSTDSIADADNIPTQHDIISKKKAYSNNKGMPRGCLDLVEEKALVHASHGHATGAPSPFCLSLVVGLQHEITKWKLAFDTQTEMMTWLCLLTDVVTQQSVDQYNVQLLHQLNPHFSESNKGKLLRRPPPVFEPTSSNNSDNTVENNPTYAKAAPSHHRLWFTEEYNIGKKHKTPTGGAATESTTAEKETNDNTSKNTTTLLVQQLERQHAAELTSREQAYTSSLAVLQETIVRLTKAQAAKQEKHNAEIKDLQAELKQFAQLAVHNNTNNNKKTGNKDNTEKEEDNENDTSEEEEEEEPDTSGSEEHHHGLPASDGWTLLSNPSMGTVARASSVLQRNVKTYGPMNALNMEDESSCWYSDGEEGATQSYTVTFAQKVAPKEVRMQFQAGFSSETCQVHGRRNNSSSFELLGNINPEDSHELQTFPLPDNTKELDAIKFVFDDMTDFYGRVTIYRLGVYGSTATAESGSEEHHHDNEGGEQFASDDSDDDDFHDATAG